MFAAIILAAGASERMGYPKALLTYRGEPFLAGILHACYAAGIERRVVVVGYYADKILREMDLSDVTVAENTQLDAGPIGSVRAGLRALEGQPVDAALVWPVDRPHVAVATLAALLDGFRASHRPIVVPVHAGHRGHPVLFGRTVFEELLDAPDEQGARAVVRHDPSRVHAVPVDDPAVLEDFNTPEDYKKLLRREDSVGGD
ncbi:MAG: nucleotidyltransferase family protein [Gemmatimonadota bacterium]|nr:nucleotidyltransferase family protein [Gemmatimonadota bacterium]